MIKLGNYILVGTMPSRQVTLCQTIYNSTFASSHLLQFQGVKGVLAAGKQQNRAKIILMFSQMGL